MQKLNLKTLKLNFPGTHWRGLALIGAQKKPCIDTVVVASGFSSLGFGDQQGIDPPPSVYK